MPKGPRYPITHHVMLSRMGHHLQRLREENHGRPFGWGAKPPDFGQFSEEDDRELWARLEALHGAGRPGGAAA